MANRNRHEGGGKPPRILFFALIVSSGILTAPVPAVCDSGTGTLRGRSYSESIADPSDILPEYLINAILKIAPAVNGEELFITDESGFFVIRDVPAGEYTIQPYHCSPSYAVKAVVERDQTTEVIVPTPYTGLYLYLFNCARSPFDDRNVRKALAMMIDGERLLTDADMTDRDPAFRFIPNGLFEGGWADTAGAVAHSPSDAERLLQNTPSFHFSISINIVANNDAATSAHERIAAKAKAGFESLSAVTTVEVISRDFGSYWAVFSSGGFDLLRFGWAMDSNNILEFFEYFFGEGNRLNYMNPTVLILLDRGRTALASKNMTAYEDALLTINAILIEDMPAIPIFYYR